MTYLYLLNQAYFLALKKNQDYLLKDISIFSLDELEGIINFLNRFND